MAITLRALIDADYGTELGLRFYAKTDTATKVGADQILAQDATISTLYTLASVSDVTVSTDYWVQLYRTDGAGTITTWITAVESYIGADGGTYEIGTDEHHATPAGGDATAANQTLILNSLTSGATVRSNVTAGGQITLKSGDDHTKAVGNAITLTVADTGGAMHTRMQDADTLQFGLRLDSAGGAAGDITGTLDQADVTYSSNVTTIVAEVTAAQIGSATTGKYRYDIQATTSGAVATEVSGPAYLQKDNV